MPSFENSPYPQWDARFEETRAEAEREIEEWYNANADRGGHAAAAVGGPDGDPAEGSWFERAGEEVKILYSDVKEKLVGLFGGEDYDPAARAEHEAAWNDEAHWQGRLRQSAESLEKQGRFGQPLGENKR